MTAQSEVVHDLAPGDPVGPDGRDRRKVVDETGRAIAPAAVDAGGRQDPGAPVYSTQGGVFELAGLVEGAYHVSVFHPDYVLEARELVVTGKEIPPLEVRLERRRS